VHSENPPDRTALQIIVEESDPGPFMLRRLAQLGVMQDRGISMSRVGAELGVSRELISQYFRGRRWPGDSPREDEIERAIEAISEREGFRVPRATRVVGPPDDTGIPDVEFIEAYIQERFYLDAMRPESLEASRSW
jgi:hypothetical protein